MCYPVFVLLQKEDGRREAAAGSARETEPQRREEMIFDTHAHYDDPAFDEDREELIGSLQAGGIGWVVDVASDEPSLARCEALARRYPFLYCALGIHPSECEEMDEALLERVRQGLRGEKCVALGEIGLDYHWEEPAREKQQYWFARQLDLAREERKPVIIHSRDAAADTLRLVREHGGEEIGGVVHCFSYSLEIAREYLDLGFFIGVGGVVTFKNAKKLQRIVQEIPLERIVLETDCPYLAPVPHRGERNSSLNLPLVAERIAQLRGTSREEVERVTLDNARRLYRLQA